MEKAMKRALEYVLVKFPETRGTWVIGILLMLVAGIGFYVFREIEIHRLIEAIIDIILWDIVMYGVLLITTKSPKRR